MWKSVRLPDRGNKHIEKNPNHKKKENTNNKIVARMGSINKTNRFFPQCTTFSALFWKLNKRYELEALKVWYKRSNGCFSSSWHFLVKGKSWVETCLVACECIRQLQIFIMIEEKAPLELKAAIPARQIPSKPYFLPHSLSIIGPLYLKLHRQFLLLWKTAIYKTSVHFERIYILLQRVMS